MAVTQGKVVLTVGVEKSTADWIKTNARHVRAQGQVVDRLVEQEKRKQSQGNKENIP